MPNGTSNKGEYDSAWCRSEHERINKRFDNLDGPDGHLSRIHRRVDHLWYLLVGVGVIGMANLIVTIVPK